MKIGQILIYFPNSEIPNVFSRVGLALGWGVCAIYFLDSERRITVEDDFLFTFFVITFSFFALSARVSPYLRGKILLRFPL